jgi:hypothetical protein
LFFQHLGDLHYYDLGSGDHGIVGGGTVANYRSSYTDVLAQTRQHELYRNLSTPYVWDDHDYGPNNSDGTLATKANAQQVYRERVPHYTLGDSSAIYYSFQVGRVLFIVSDARSDRSPSSDPDQPGKGILGTAQKAWMQSILETSDAEFFIWILPTQWMGTSADSYNSYMTERSEMISMFNATEWRERMIIIGGDYHGLAIDTGANSPGGIPVFQFASLDSTPGSGSGGDYDRGSQDGRNQYGTIEVDDDVDSITVTGTGWFETSVWQSHSLTIEIESDEEPPPPPPTSLPEVVETFVGLPHYRYVFGQVRTGRITAEIPLYGVSMNTLLNAPSDLTGTFIMNMTGFRNQDLVSATEPGRTFVVVERDGFPIWDGLIVAQVYQAQSSSMQIFARSLSAYPSKVKMDGDYFPDGFVVTDVEQTEAFLTLWETLQGVPESDIHVQLPEALSTGIAISLDVQPYEDKTFGQVLEEIANSVQGFDWRIVTRKIDGAYARIMQIGYPTIGTEDARRLVFEYPGPMMNYWRTRSVSEHGTHIHGLGSGQGEDMLRADVVHQDLIDGGYLRWDVDVPLKEVTNQVQLDGLTVRAGELARATRYVYSVEMKGDQQPEFGTYLQGDACTLKFEDPAHPDGFRLATRVIGWRLTPPSDTSVEKVAVYFEGGEADGG